MSISIADADGNITIHEDQIAPSFPMAPNPALLALELDRRLALGFDFSFGDERGVHHFGTTPKDMSRWMDEVTPLAQAYINSGQSGGEIAIKTETGPVTLTAGEWQLVLLGAAAYRQPLYQCYFAMKEMETIPLDYADDARWQMPT